MKTLSRATCAAIFSLFMMGAHAQSAPAPERAPKQPMAQPEKRMEERHAQQRERLSARQQAQLEHLTERKAAITERLKERRATAQARTQATRERIAENHKKIEQVRKQRPAPQPAPAAQ